MRGVIFPLLDFLVLVSFALSAAKGILQSAVDSRCVFTLVDCNRAKELADTRIMRGGNVTHIQSLHYYPAPKRGSPALVVNAAM